MLSAKGQETNMSHIEIRCGLLLGVGILIAMVSPVQAQSVPPCTPSTIAGGPSATAGIKNAPFSATGKETLDQRLPGGNAFHGVGLSRMARDSAGRTWFERLTRCWHGQDGNIHATWNVSVNDNVAGKRLTWDTGDLATKVVYVTPLPAYLQPPTPEVLAVLAQQKREAALFQPPQNELQIEDLGTKKINGVSAEGKRTTRKIPAGEVGNDLPMTTVDEVWNSKQLGQMVMTINDDPRRGRLVLLLEDVKLKEPDASLFVAPADYTVKEIKPAN